MANATLRERQTQYKSCPQNVYLIPSQTAVNICFVCCGKKFFGNLKKIFPKAVDIPKITGYITKSEEKKPTRPHRLEA